MNIHEKAQRQTEGVSGKIIREVVLPPLPSGVRRTNDNRRIWASFFQPTYIAKADDDIAVSPPSVVKLDPREGIIGEPFAPGSFPGPVIRHRTGFSDIQLGQRYSNKGKKS